MVESVAIAKYFARMDRSKGLLGETSIDEANIDKWLFWGQTSVVPTFGKVLAPMFGWATVDPKDHQEACKTVKDLARQVNNALEGKEFLVGAKVTLADYAVAALFFMYMQVLLEKNFRKSIPLFEAWFARIAADKFFTQRFGKAHFCERTCKVGK